MDENRLTEIARDNLARVLGFFPRVDTLLSVILALNLGLLAVLGSNAPPVHQIDSSSFAALIFLLFSVVTFYHLYKCAFPRLDGGHTSLIYFREIANKTELEYCEKFKDISAEGYLDDLIEQTWRNSVILKEKFNHLRLAFTFLILSLLFWVPALLVFVSRNTASLLAK